MINFQMIGMSVGPALLVWAAVLAWRLNLGKSDAQPLGFRILKRLGVVATAATFLYWFSVPVSLSAAYSASLTMQAKSIQKAILLYSEDNGELLPGAAWVAPLQTYTKSHRDFEIDPDRRDVGFGMNHRVLGKSLAVMAPTTLLVAETSAKGQNPLLESEDDLLSHTSIRSPIAASREAVGSLKKKPFHWDLDGKVAVDAARASSPFKEPIFPPRIEARHRLRATKDWALTYLGWTGLFVGALYVCWKTRDREHYSMKWWIALTGFFAVMAIILFAPLCGC